MGMVVNHNIPALQTYNVVNATSNALAKSIKKLSTGMRINSAADDAAGLAISEKMRAQINGLSKATDNAEDAISMLQTAEGALAQTHSILQRMRELSVQAANDTLTSQDRAYIQEEVSQLRDEITNIGNTTQFNTKKLLNGDAAALWSADTTSTKAIIKGGLRSIDAYGQKVTSEGNYKIVITADPGTAQVQKTDIMKIKHEQGANEAKLDKRQGNEKAGVVADGVTQKNLDKGEYTIEGAATKAANVGKVYNLSSSLSEDSTGSIGTDLKVEVDNATPTLIAANTNLKVTVVGVDTVVGKITVNVDGTVTGVDGKVKEVHLAGEDFADNNNIDLATKLGLVTSGDAAAGALKLTSAAAASGKFKAGDTFTVSTTANAYNKAGTNTAIDPTGLADTDAEFVTLTNDVTGSKYIVDAAQARDNKKVTLGGLNSYGNATEIELTVDENFTKENINNEGTLATLNIKSNPDSVYVNSDEGAAKASVTGADGADPSDGIYTVRTTTTAPTTFITFADAKYAGTGTFNGAAHKFDSSDTAVKVAAANGTAATGLNLLATATAFKGSGSLAVEVLKDIEVKSGTTGGAASGSTATSTLAKAVRVTYTYMDKEGNVTTDTAELDAAIIDNSGRVETAVGANVNSSATINLKDILGTAGADDAKLSLNSILASVGDPAVVNSLKAGDAFVINFTKDLGAAGAGDDFVYLATSATDLDGANLDNPGATYALKADKVLDGSELALTTYSFNDKSGDLETQTINLEANDNFAGANMSDGDILARVVVETPAKTNAAANAESDIGKIATLETKLYDIDKFWTTEGVFMVEDPQTITITQGDGKQAKVTIYQNDKVSDVVDKLNKAIASDERDGGLGQGKYVENPNSFVTYIEDGKAEKDTAESVKGTFVIRSAVAGAAGELNFAASENILNALSLNQIKASKESEYIVSVYDAHTGDAITPDEGVKITGNKLIGVINENVDVEFDAMCGDTVKAKMGDDKMFILEQSKDYTTFLHLADNTTVFQVGANEGEDMGVNIGDMRATALGLDQVLVTDRNSASRSITIIDNAIDKVSTQRAKLGAYQNRLEYKVSNLTTAYENMTSAESRIRDTDMAAEMMNFMKLQINSQAGTAMLAQANQLTRNVLSLLG